MSRRHPEDDPGYREWMIPCTAPDHPEGEHHHLPPYPPDYSFSRFQVLDSKGVRVERHSGVSCCTGVQTYWAHVTTEAERLDAARTKAEQLTGDRTVADQVLAAFNDPWATQ